VPPALGSLQASQSFGRAASWTQRSDPPCFHHLAGGHYVQVFLHQKLLQQSPKIDQRYPSESATQVRNFFGLAVYYRRFIPIFSKISKPIIELLKKGTKYVWTKDCDEAFQTLKKLLTTSPVLAQHDIAKLFDVYCDASGNGLGCVLIQEGRVISYYSQ
jgi:hypothetical protein